VVGHQLVSRCRFAQAVKKSKQAFPVTLRIIIATHDPEQVLAGCKFPARILTILPVFYRSILLALTSESWLKNIYIQTLILRI
jgi:hypothetical protein